MKNFKNVNVCLGYWYYFLISLVLHFNTQENTCKENRSAAQNNGFSVCSSCICVNTLLNMFLTFTALHRMNPVLIIKNDWKKTKYLQNK